MPLEPTTEEYERRSTATVYERTAWLHDRGQHEGADLPYLFCPRCEMEHPLGRYAVVRSALVELVDALCDELALEVSKSPEMQRKTRAAVTALYGAGGDYHDAWWLQ